jgi:hypothetical protein
MATTLWRIEVDDAVYQVEAGSSWTGAVYARVNGTEVGRGPRWRDTKRRITFALGRHMANLVWTVYGRGVVRYDLVLDGHSVTTGGQPRPPADPDTSLGVSSLLLAAVVAILVGVVWFGALPEIRLAVEGRETNARVTGGRVETGKSTSYYLRYVFVTAGGSARTAEGRVSYATYTTIHNNDVIRVVYLPSEPDIQRPTSYDDRIWIVGLAAMFAVGLLVTAPMVWRAYRDRRMSAALIDRAVRTRATVEKVSPQRLGVGLSRITYRYEDAEGRSHTGISPSLYAEEASAYAAGSSATIAYDPNDPGNSMWLGAADPRATVWVTT